MGARLVTQAHYGQLNGILTFIGGIGPFPLHGLPYIPVHAVWTSSVREPPCPPHLQKSSPISGIPSVLGEGR